MNNLTILAIDIAKNVFQLHGNDNRPGAKDHALRGKTLIYYFKYACVY
ncbi:hypothetical protein L3V86_09485 [Thiotrichales bacterium 19S11-10]|nr:hypothetical protein [Thiotrichales bacterium 19S11-10]